jgi:NADP-dependent 3-hydroxy acid dehydrogenase YdfG
MGSAPEALQVAQRVLAHDHDLAAAPAVTAVGAATGDVGFAAEARAAVAAGPGLDVDPRAIVEHADHRDSRARAERAGSGYAPFSKRPRRAEETRHMSEHSSPTTDRVFLITGASSGIGAATARRACEEGWRVVLAARSEDRLRALAEELGGEERALALRCDVTEWEDQQRLVAAALEAFGSIDVAFANAGFGGPRGFLKDTPEHWREMVLTNVYGAALTLRATIPALTESRGHAILTSSVAGRRVLPGSMYSCTKHAVTAMGEAARQDLHGTGVRVTLIEPGMTDTPFFDERPTDALEDDDIARAVLYAASQPAHVNVNEILVRPTAQAG